VAAVAPRRHPRRPQASRAADAPAGLAGRVPASRLARRVDPAGPEGHASARPRAAQLHRHRTEPAVGGRPPPASRAVRVFWLAAVRDAFSNRIVGWRCSDRCDTDLVLGALEYAIWTRHVRDGQLIHHSDKGSNYTSFRFSTRLSDNGILASMGSTGDSYDNALMENFW